MASELRLPANTLGNLRSASTAIQHIAHTNAFDECHIGTIKANCREAVEYVHIHLGVTEDSPDETPVPPEVAQKAIEMMGAAHSAKIMPRTR